MNSTQPTSHAKLRVRYAETDAQQITHHASYLVYFEVGRSTYIRERGASYAEFEAEGLFLAVTEANLRYIQPAFYDDLLTVVCTLAQARSRSVTFEYEIVKTETQQTLVTGSTKHICLNRDNQVSRIPQTWLDRLSAQLA